jgi:chaperonin cofactor prefoldin
VKTRQIFRAVKYKHPLRLPIIWGCLIKQYILNYKVYQMSNPVIETNIADILQEIKSDQKEILKEVGNLKVGQAQIEGKIESINEKLSGQIKTLDTKVEQLDKRISKVTFCVGSFPHKS